jgi:hypothetical protein
MHTVGESSKEKKEGENLLFNRKEKYIRIPVDGPKVFVKLYGRLDFPERILPQLKDQQQHFQMSAHERECFRLRIP